MTQITITPVTPVLGAVVGNVQINEDLESGVFEAIEKALTKYLVLVFKNQNLSASDLKNFTSRFGPLFLHHSDDGVIFNAEVPEVLEMVKKPEGARLFGGSDWHADVTFRKPEGLVSVLYSIEVPPNGGDTAFASGIAAYEALSPAMQKMLDSLSAVHSYNGRGRPDHETETAIHPVVRTHSAIGRRSLYINRMFVTRFDGMSESESEPLIDFLDKHISSPQFTCRISWQPQQVVMWDNRFTLHYPINDFTGHRRRLLRCTAMCTD